MDFCAVLLVDDDEDLLHSVGELLKHHGFLVHTATSVMEGMALLRQRAFDVIVADHDLGPEGSGELLLAFAAEAFPQSGRILYSGVAVESGSAHVVIDKPEIETLLEWIRGWRS
jgi:DNA-binding NtrC family response regulator